MAVNWFSPPAAVPLSGSEQFIGSGAVKDFWAFAMPDLRMNNVRGHLAEFLVARAVGSVRSKIEWDPYDVLTPDGIKIEVKSSGFLQSWDQKRTSKIVFSGLKGRTWTPQGGESSSATYNADVYVFCVQSAMTHAEYDPLDVGQWQFYVVPVTDLARLNYKAIGFTTLRSIAPGPVDYENLATAISEANEAS